MNQKPAVEGKPDLNAPETEPQTTLEPSPTDETTETQELVESLRKMLIGGHIRDYNQRFRSIDGELEGIQQFMETRYAELESQFDQKMEALGSELRNGLKELNRKLSERIGEVANQKESEVRKLTQSFNALAQELREKMDRLTNQHTNQIMELRDGLRRNHEAIKGELNTKAEALDRNKLNRFALADNLIALGMKLKEKNILDDFNMQTANERKKR